MAHDHRNGIVTLAAAGLVLVGMVGGGVWGMEIRYAKSVDLTQHIETNRAALKELSADILESRRQSIRREIFTMEQAEKTRKGGLTQEERAFLDELRQRYQEASEKLQRLRR
jgi:hypothetical protein